MNNWLRLLKGKKQQNENSKISLNLDTHNKKEEVLKDISKVEIEKMKRLTERYLNYDIKQLKADSLDEAQIYLGLIRNIHSKKIKDYSYEFSAMEEKLKYYDNVISERYY